MIDAAIARAGLMIVQASGLDDLDQALERLDAVLSEAADPTACLHLMASAAQTRFRLTGSAADLGRCNRYLEELLLLYAPGDPRRPATEAWLGLNLADEPGSRERAIRLLARARRTAADLPPEIADRLPWTLGRLLAEAADTVLGPLSGPAAAGALTEVALILADDAGPVPEDRLAVLTALAETVPAEDVHGAAARGLSSLVDGADGGAWLDRATAALTPDDPLYAALMAARGTHFARRGRAGDAAALVRAERCYRAAVRLPVRAGVGVLRAANLVVRARRESRTDLADRAISTLESVLAALSTTDLWHPRALRAAGEAWTVRGTLCGVPAEIVRGCQLIIAAAEATPLAHPDRPELLAAAIRAQDVLATRSRP
ncbi:hypothetical protein [Actinocorallia longicatena]|uniref:Uncharacterized protein n=1 Tax=Actinocorallia longicatena TaxID=111803 RepID=A0ABP6Q001_9ACTN